MPNASDLIEVHFKDRRFILAWTTIKAFPKSLLAEKLDSIEEPCKQIDIVREAGQFELIKQLMIYRSRTRKADILGADNQVLQQELDFFHLEGLLEHVSVWQEDIDAPIDHARLSNFTLNHDAKLFFSPSMVRGPTLIVGLPIKLFVDEGLFEIFDYRKYHVVQWERSILSMEYYTGPGHLAMSYYAEDNRAQNDYNEYDQSDWDGPQYNQKQNLKQQERTRLKIMYLFLLAIDKFDHKQNILIGRNRFKELFGEDIVNSGESKA